MTLGVLGVAFALGLAARSLGLPPLVGFLLSGFVLNALGFSGSETLDQIGDAGVLLLLFWIGLKLHIKSLLRPEIWATATIHMLVTVVLFGSGIFALSVAGLSVFAGLDLPLSMLVAFALSFSSTVFAVKVLEERGEMCSRHGRVAIGILVMQDIFAVVFMTVSAGEAPSPWALLLLGLPLARPLLLKLLARAGHSELLVLLGVLITIGGAGLFKSVGLKPDLGALVFGALVAGHPKADELSKVLLGFKDLFLVGFFLTIGLSGLPSPSDLGIAVLLVLAVPIKVALFLVLLTRFKLRARTSTLTSLSLANYSEFGLIVGSLAVSSGWLEPGWLVIIACALSLTFVGAAPLNAAAQQIYSRFSSRLCRLETVERLSGDDYLDPKGARVIVFGMGRVGTGAYDVLRNRFGDSVIGVEMDEQRAHTFGQQGRQVIVGDASDCDLWARARGLGELELVMLAMGDHQANLDALRELRKSDYAGHIASVAAFADHISELEAAGAHAVFDTFAEAGSGFAEHVLERLERPTLREPGENRRED